MKWSSWEKLRDIGTMLHICEHGFKGPEMARGEMYGLLVGASMALSASGNYQVRTVYQRSGEHVFTEFLELIAPLPPQNATTTKDMSQTDGPLGLTEEEERELAELMGDV
jgi:hypothetical protein